MVQRLEHLLNGEKLNQQGSLCGKETPRVNKIMGGVETRNRACLLTLCCNSTDMNGRKKNLVSELACCHRHVDKSISLNLRQRKQ